jgi:glucose/arabinose dehydrogenase
VKTIWYRALFLPVVACGGGAPLSEVPGRAHARRSPAKSDLDFDHRDRPGQGLAPHAPPTAAAGFSVAAYAHALNHPRWLYALPNGDVLVAKTNGRPGPTRGVLTCHPLAYFGRRSIASAQRLEDQIRRLLSPVVVKAYLLLWVWYF